MSLIPVRFWTRRCRGCSDTSTHDSHLTWLGRLALGIRGARSQESSPK